MATFISLISLTQHGEADVQSSVDRANAFRSTAEQVGAQVKDVYWTLGSCDGVLIFDAPNDETAASLLLSLGAKGSVRSQTMRAFNSEEMQSVLSSMPK